MLFPLWFGFGQKYIQGDPKGFPSQPRSAPKNHPLPTADSWLPVTRLGRSDAVRMLKGTTAATDNTSQPSKVTLSTILTGAQTRVSLSILLMQIPTISLLGLRDVFSTKNKHENWHIGTTAANNTPQPREATHSAFTRQVPSVVSVNNLAEYLGSLRVHFFLSQILSQRMVSA